MMESSRMMHDDDENREEHLVGHIADIVRVGYDYHDFYGHDVSMLDLPELHHQARRKIKASRNPHILLVHQNKLRCAALAIIMEYWGARVTTAYSGKEAYLKFLKKEHLSFDLAIIEWDMSDVSGRDLTHYVRQSGSRLCIVALMGTTITPGFAIRGGADLFLRMPLVIHMHVIRSLVFPAEFAAAGFPAHLLVQCANYAAMQAMLNTALLRSRDKEDEVDQLSHEIRDRQKVEVDEETFNQVIAYLQQRQEEELFPKQLAKEPYLMKLKEAIKRLLQTANENKSKAASLRSEIRLLRGQLKECDLLHAYKPLEETQPDEMDMLSRNELKERLLIHNRQYSVTVFELDKLTDDYCKLSEDHVLLHKIIDDISAGENPPLSPKTGFAKGIMEERSFASTKGKKRNSVYVSLRDLRARLQRAKGAKEPAGIKAVHERLECELMEREDRLFNRAVLPSPVVLKLRWPAFIDVPSAKNVYQNIRNLLCDSFKELNAFSAKTLSLFPTIHPHLENLREQLTFIITRESPFELFSKDEVSRPLITSKRSQSSVASHMKNRSMLNQCFRLLIQRSECSRLRRAMYLWQLWCFERSSGRVAPPSGALSMHKMDKRMLQLDREKQQNLRREFYDVKRQRDAALGQLQQAQAAIEELHAQLDAAEWSLPEGFEHDKIDFMKQAEKLAEREDKWTQTEITNPGTKECVAVQVALIDRAPLLLLNERKDTTPQQAKTVGTAANVEMEMPQMAPVRVEPSSPGQRRKSVMKDAGKMSRTVSTMQNLVEERKKETSRPRRNTVVNERVQEPLLPKKRQTTDHEPESQFTFEQKNVGGSKKGTKMLAAAEIERSEEHPTKKISIFKDDESKESESNTLQEENVLDSNQKGLSEVVDGASFEQREGDPSVSAATHSKTIDTLQPVDESEMSAAKPLRVAKQDVSSNVILEESVNREVPDDIEPETQGQQSKQPMINVSVVEAGEGENAGVRTKVAVENFQEQSSSVASAKVSNEQAPTEPPIPEDQDAEELPTLSSFDASDQKNISKIQAKFRSKVALKTDGEKICCVEEVAREQGTSQKNVADLNQKTEGNSVQPVHFQAVRRVGAATSPARVLQARSQDLSPNRSPTAEIVSTQLDLGQQQQQIQSSVNCQTSAEQVAEGNPSLHPTEEVDQQSLQPRGTTNLIVVETSASKEQSQASQILVAHRDIKEILIPAVSTDLKEATTTSDQSDIAPGAADESTEQSASFQDPMQKHVAASPDRTVSNLDVEKSRVEQNSSNKAPIVPFEEPVRPTLAAASNADIVEPISRNDGNAPSGREKQGTVLVRKTNEQSLFCPQSCPDAKVGKDASPNVVVTNGVSYFDTPQTQKADQPVEDATVPFNDVPHVENVNSSSLTVNSSVSELEAELKYSWEVQFVLKQTLERREAEEAAIQQQLLQSTSELMQTAAERDEAVSELEAMKRQLIFYERALSQHSSIEGSANVTLEATPRGTVTEDHPLTELGKASLSKPRSALENAHAVAIKPPAPSNPFLLRTAPSKPTESAFDGLTSNVLVPLPPSKAATVETAPRVKMIGSSSLQSPLIDSNTHGIQREAQISKIGGIRDQVVHQVFGTSEVMSQVQVSVPTMAVKAVFSKSPLPLRSIQTRYGIAAADQSHVQQGLTVTTVSAPDAQTTAPQPAPNLGSEPLPVITKNVQLDEVKRKLSQQLLVIEPNVSHVHQARPNVAFVQLSRNLAVNAATKQLYEQPRHIQHPQNVALQPLRAKFDDIDFLGISSIRPSIRADAPTYRRLYGQQFSRLSPKRVAAPPKVVPVARYGSPYCHVSQPLQITAAPLKASVVPQTAREPVPESMIPSIRQRGRGYQNFDPLLRQNKDYLWKLSDVEQRYGFFPPIMIRNANVR